jgi:tetratricopeptide (TPR) repeat protein
VNETDAPFDEGFQTMIEDAFDEAIDDDLFLRGHAELEAREFAHARVSFQRWIENVPDFEARAKRYLAIGAFFELEGDFDVSLELLAAGLVLEPRSRYVSYFLHNNTGYILGCQGKFAEAEPFCRAALEVDRLRHNAHKNLALARIGQGQWAEGALHLVHACRLRPDDDRALVHLADLIVERGDALSALWLGIMDCVRPMRSLVEQQRKRKRPRAAAAPGPVALSPATRAALEHAAEAETRLDQGQPEEAAQACERALACSGHDHPTHIRLLELASLASCFLPRPKEEQVRITREAIAWDPLNREAWRRLAQLLASPEDAVEAAKAWVNVVSLDLRDEEAFDRLSDHYIRFQDELSIAIPDLEQEWLDLYMAVEQVKAMQTWETPPCAGTIGPGGLSLKFLRVTRGNVRVD